eukprot:TRINITY_DN42933_c0_g1_i1.p1 TRINITY_DN42933_c0_g1~~TRINITY_DN42933_c0_g1_i1.p1  ORF type:complete len:234 (+),score=63.42 TRINITY_DN42933_c0_g1_i1:36-737(+)
MGDGDAGEGQVDEPAESAEPADAANASSQRPMCGNPRTPEEWVDEALHQKEVGTQAYKEERFSAAVDAWCMSRGSLKHILERKMFENDSTRQEEVRQLLLSVHLNLAQGSLKNGEFYQTIQHCGRALELDPKSVKALYRKAAGQVMGSLFSEARETLNELLQLEPGNAGAAQMLREIDRKEKLALKSGKKAAKRMVSGMERDPRVALSAGEAASSWIAELLRCGFCRKRAKDE